MKKAIGITLSVIGIIMAAISLVFKVNEQISVTKSVSVIGGADGPTSIFVAGKIGGTPAITGIIVGIVLLAIGIFIFARKK
jgi:oxaloacetate decarboxylase beta subunit